MKMRTKKAIQPYDIWNADATLKKSCKLHPSLKRSKKTPLPHPGQSYNPNPDDHRRLLEKVAKKELAYQAKEKNLKEALSTTVTAAEVSQHEDEELVSGIEHLIKENHTSNNHLKDCDSGSETDDVFKEYDEKDFQAIIADKSVIEKRKSKQQRLKQMKDKLQRKAARLRKLKNIRLSKFDAIKKITKELDKKDKEKAEQKKAKPKRIKNERLGQKFEQSDPIYCLSEDLPSSLRHVSCSMNAIVREQLESFQSRLLVEPTSLQVKTRKYKRKEFGRKTAAEQEV